MSEEFSRLALRQFAARASIEDEYARKMTALCRKPLGSSEAGTLRASLDVMRGEVESMGKSHQAIAHQMKSELEEPLIAFSGGMKERRKIVQNGVEKLFKVKQQQTQVVNKVCTIKAADHFERLTPFSQETGMSRIVSRSKDIWRRVTWSWAKKNGRTRPKWKRPRSSWLPRVMNMKLL